MLQFSHTNNLLRQHGGCQIHAGQLLCQYVTVSEIIQDRQISDNRKSYVIYLRLLMALSKVISFCKHIQGQYVEE